MQVETARPAQCGVERGVVVGRREEDAALLRPDPVERVQQPAQRHTARGVRLVRPLLVLGRLVGIAVLLLRKALGVREVALDALVERRVDVLDEHDALLGEL